MLNIIYGDCTFGIGGSDFHYIFSYQAGGLESLVIDGAEWLYRVPKPTFWRATTDNDRGSQFHLKSSMWFGADQFISCENIEVVVDGKEITKLRAPYNNNYTGKEQAKHVKLSFTYATTTIPKTETLVCYEINQVGDIKVEVTYFGKVNLPQLPVFGMRFIIPVKATHYRYEGLSGETYPDRMAGGIPGIYEIEGLPITKYLVPQDCNVHMNTKWLEVYRNTTKDNSWQRTDRVGIRFSYLDKKFAFSCIPYISGELEMATHQEELPVPRRTVVSILGAVRGVGGIDSWGSDVESMYHISGEKDIHYSFTIERVNKDNNLSKK